MDFGKAFTYVFDDQDWIKKVGIGALLMLIPLLGQIMVGGYALEATKRVIRREERPLPDWTDFGSYIVMGLQVMVIGFVYALPIILISACSQGLVFAGQEGGDDTLMSVAAIVSVCFGCLSLLYGVLIGLMVPAAMGNFAASEQFGAAFRFGEVFGLVKAAPGAYVLVLLGSFLAGLVSMLGLILCFIGVVLTVAYAMLISAHLQGQAYNAAIEAKAMQV
jgi:hypothetical protein